MNALQRIQLADVDIQDIVEHPGDYPIEIVGATMDVLIDMSRQLREAKLRIEGHIIADMQSDGATKVDIIGHDGAAKTITLKKGSQQANKNAEEMYRDAGFPAEEIGEYVFKASWTKAKEALKRGGKKKEVITQIFQQGKDSITIK